MRSQKISRRELLRIALLVGIGGVVSCKNIVNGKVDVAAASTQYPEKQYLPAITRSSPVPTPSPSPAPTPSPVPTIKPTQPPSGSLGPQVVRVHANAVTNWTSGIYWDSVNQTVTDQMTQQGLLNLTGKSSIAEAWRIIMPNYVAGQTIAIKVNFNNSFSCTSSTAIDALPEYVNSLVKTLVDGLNVSPSNIRVFDAVRKIPLRFASKNTFGTVLFDKSYETNCNYNVAGWQESITFRPPPGQTVSSQQLSDVITTSDYLINMPIMKKHFGAGVTLGFKNHFGSISNPGGLHTRIFVGESLFSTTYNPLIDIYMNPHIRNKTVLTVGDGIFGSLWGENQPPIVWDTFGGKPPKSLFFSTDPVAIDSVMADYLIAELGSSIPANSVMYLPLAETAGLGVYEHRNPWSQAYSKIQYRQLEV